MIRRSEHVVSRWHLAEPIAPEIHVLDRVLRELVRQVGVHCWERGSLLQRVRVRYWNILEVEELYACSGMSNFLDEL